MSAEQSAVREAWGRIPAPGRTERGLEQFARQRIERIISVVVAVGSIALGGQALLDGLTTMARVTPAHLTLLALAFVPLAAMVVACIIGRGIRTTASAFVIGYLLVLAAWPFVATHAGLIPGSQPWIFFLVNVATGAAVLALSLPGQILVAVVAPLGYGLVRLSQGGFRGSFWTAVAFDVSFTLIMGAVLVALGWVFRSVAQGVDDARMQVVQDYADAATVEASEQERVAVGALMHDSVLAALISAERARSPREQQLAVSMAREALTRLADTEEQDSHVGPDEPVALTAMLSELREALRVRELPTRIDRQGALGLLPGPVSRALILAARQALDNVVAHADGRGLSVHVCAGEDERITLTVRDEGPGFALDEVPADRLGIRGSIIARMAAVGGKAEVVSSAEGTTVVMTWPVL